MTAAAFRKLALSLPEAEERSHMQHPDFRVAGKMFATLLVENFSEIPGASASQATLPNKSRGQVISPSAAFSVI